jgi:hypothetical protein
MFRTRELLVALASVAILLVTVAARATPVPEVQIGDWRIAGHDDTGSRRPHSCCCSTGSSWE